MKMVKEIKNGNPAGRNMTVAPTTFAVGESTSCVAFPAKMDHFRRLFVISKSHKIKRVVIDTYLLLFSLFINRIQIKNRKK